MTDADIIAALDELAAQHPELGIPSEMESLALAARECGDEGAREDADELARRAEWEE